MQENTQETKKKRNMSERAKFIVRLNGWLGQEILMVATQNSIEATRYHELVEQQLEKAKILGIELLVNPKTGRYYLANKEQEINFPKDQKDITIQESIDLYFDQKIAEAQDLQKMLSSQILDKMKGQIESLQNNEPISIAEEVEYRQVTEYILILHALKKEISAVLQVKEKTKRMKQEFFQE